MIAFLCRSCGQKLKVKDALAGKKGKCPRCGLATRIPSASPGLADEQTLPPSDDNHPETYAGLDSSGEDSGTSAAAAELTAFLAPAQRPGELGRLGPYRVLKVLGHGGMGVVFKAEDTTLERAVALKAMLPAFSASSTARERFGREAKAAAAVKHDNVVTIYQVGEDRGVPFLAMEFLEGQSLDDRLKKAPRPPLAEVLRIGREIAEGLAAAHERGLIHRDIKPANVWLEGERGRVKILDFGLARAAASQAHLTQTGAILGTPAFMSPEQTRGETVDPRCDLFSLGCVLYRMCAGELPFQGPDTISTLLAVALETPRPLRSLNPETSPELANLVMRLLAKKAADRPATAREAAQELRALEQRLTSGGPTVVIPPPPLSMNAPVTGKHRGRGRAKGKQSAPPSRSRLLFVGLAGLMLLLGGVFVWQVLRPRSKESVHPQPSTAEAIAFFNGKDLTGWEGQHQYWKVENGALVGAAPQGLKSSAFLCSKKQYRNFELTCQVRIVGEKANAGLMFRSQLLDSTRFIVNGPQADMGEGYWGDLYDERVGGGRLKSAPAWEVSQSLKPNDFNDLSVRCVGQRVTIKLNGVTTVAGEFEQIPAEGIIAWQLHHGRPVEATIRNISFTELPEEPRWVQLFDGKSLAGWKVHPPNVGRWKIENGVIVSAGPKSYLVSERNDYENFHFRVEARINDKGNSGQFFRVRPGVGGWPAGYEAQIATPDGDPQQWTGSLYNIVPIRERLHDANEWFSQEVIADGDRITIKVDGKEVVIVKDSTYKKGFFALQHNSRETVVHFRKIEVKELPPSK